mgnify:FL=1
MQKLRELIEAHARWSEFSIFVDRIESSRDQDFSLAFENAKALLESVCKEICKSCGKELSPQSSMNGIVKTSFSVLGFSTDEISTRISGSLASIGQVIGELRNDIGVTGHGRTVEELRQRNSKIDELTKDFLFDSIKTIIIFLIRSFEYKQLNKIDISEKEQENERNKEFDEFLDEIYGEFVMGDYSYTASQILFAVDSEAYQYARKNFEAEERNQA